MLSFTTPPPNVQTTTNCYDVLGRVSPTLLPDNTFMTNEYYDTGELKKQYGSRTYPVQYAYDYAGRMNTMKTWQTNGVDSSAATTTWNYSTNRGFLTSKKYNDNQGPSYTYTPAGRLYRRTWARGVTTTYLTNTFGDIASITNSGTSPSTPGVTNSFDRLGRLTGVQDGTGTHLLSYDLAGRLLAETNSAGLLAGLGLVNAYDTLGRRNSLSLNVQPSPVSISFGYDPASRLSGVTNGNVNVAYSYLANSPFVEQIISRQNGTTRMTTTKTYDYLNRLTRISSVPSASSVVSFDYAYNNANQRTTVTLGPDGSYWAYGYDGLGQVVSGKKYWYDGVPFAGQQFEYTFDDIGNRKQTKAGGDASGQNLRIASYTNNLLNQITGRQVPGSNDIIGIAHASAAVTVNGQSPYRRGEYYRTELLATNAAMVTWQPVTNKAVLAGTTNILTNSILTPCRGQPFWYDADGNLLSDGVWTNTWDAENRLVRMLSVTGAPTNAWFALNFAYDGQGRRISKVVSNWNGAAWVKKTEQRFAYDGWNLLAILSSDLSLQSSFTWGLDLSGSIQGAGGVGGLLAVNDSSNGTSFVAYDGNGNVAALVSATNGTASAQYEYGPFGELLRATGPMAATNHFRFSTKYQDDETDLLYYGRRFYEPCLGRWPARDPIEENRDLNLYGFARNSPPNIVDKRGLDCSRPNNNGSDPDIGMCSPGRLPAPTPGPPGIQYWWDEPQWFKHPPEENKVCCCKPPACLSAQRIDPPPTRIPGTENGWTLHFQLSIKVEGCYKDVAVLWKTCERPDGTGGFIAACINSQGCDMDVGEGGKYLTDARIRWLSCEDRKWIVHILRYGPLSGAWLWEHGTYVWNPQR